MLRNDLGAKRDHDLTDVANHYAGHHDDASTIVLTMTRTDFADLPGTNNRDCEPDVR